MGSGADGLGDSGGGVRVLSGVGAVGLGTAVSGSGFGLGGGFGSAGLEAAFGSGLGRGLSFASAGLVTSKCTSSGCSWLFSGEALISVDGGALGVDTAADSGLGLVSGATEIVTAVDSEI